MSGDEVTYGPHKIAQNGQVVIPKDVLRLANLAPGANVWFVPRDGVVELLPAAIIGDWVREGRAKRP